MADNSLRTPSGSESIVTREVSHGGDTSKVAGSFIVGIAGTEGSYTYEAIDGSAANGLEVDVTRVQGTVTVDLGDNNDVTLATLPDTASSDLGTINTNIATLSGTVSSGKVTIIDGGDILTNTVFSGYMDDIFQEDGQIVDGVDPKVGVLIQGEIDGGPTGNVLLDANQYMKVVLQASTNTTEVVGDVAHDAAAAGNPVAVAARATNSVEGLTQVGAADATYLTADLNGCAVTRPQTTLEEVISERVANTNGTSTAFTNFDAGGAGVHNYVTTIVIYNSSSTDGYVDIRDGAAGSVLFTVPAPQTSGCVINLPVPLKGSANTALAYDVSGAIDTVYISMVGFQAQG